MNSSERNKIIDSFKNSGLLPRIVFLGNHGSSLYKEIKKESESDFDIEIILDNPQSDDCLTIKNIVKAFPFRAECQLRYESELNTGMIKASSYKVFMYYVYAHSELLLGKNLYADLVGELDNLAIRKSLLISAQIAFKDIRKSYIADKTPYEVNKNIVRFLACTCFYFGIFSSQDLGTRKIFELSETGDIVNTFLEKFNGSIDANEKATILQFKDSLKAGKFFNPIFAVISSIAEKIYKA